MSEEAESQEASVAEETQEASAGLASALEKTQSFRDDIEKKLPTAQKKKLDEWWQALMNEVTADDFKFQGTAIKSVEQRIAEIDEQISEQLSAVMHHPEFQKLEGTWAGLKRFVNNTEVKKGVLEIHVLNCSKDDLAKDFQDAGKPHQSELYMKTVRKSYQVFGGVPFGILVGDYEWTGHPSDIATLTDFAKVASASHTSLITAPSPELLGKDSWEELDGLNDNNFADIFQAPECIEWRDFREADESRYVTLAMPRYMSRLPYGKGISNTAVKEFDFEELALPSTDEDGNDVLRFKRDPGVDNIEVSQNQFCWSNAAYALAERITESFFVWGWTTSIRGVENGGLVRDLPLYKYKSPAGDTKVHCPSEIVLDFEQEFSLSKNGFCPLQYYLEKNYSVFAGGQTAHQPQEVMEDEAQASENLSARLPYILAVSRITHFCKAIAHDKVGSFLERSDAEKWLNKWVMQYVEKGENPSDAIKRKKPFKDAKIMVRDKPGDPGFYEVTVRVAPWIQFEGMTADITMVADIERAEAETAQ